MSRPPPSAPGAPDATFGQWLKERRVALGLTREELAARADCSPETIYKVEAGTRRPSRQIAEILATLFDIPADEREAFIGFARGQGGGPREANGGAGQEHPWRPSRRVLTNLPAQVTSFIGRDGEVAQLRTLLLRDRVRLVTLVGPPGIGKTRLAQEVAGHLLDSPVTGTPSFEDGIWFVPLAPVTDPGLVIPTVATALGVSDSGTQPLHGTLTQQLHDKRLLLVLDNFEQILGAGSQIAQLLAACPWLKVLVTSREALRVYGERQYPLPPLDVRRSPDEPGAGHQALGTIPSVELFVERAQALRPDFALTEENAEAIAKVCERLDGLPLAIELAAARIGLFSPQSMLGMLERSLQVLTTGARDLPPRHQTLRGAIEWSYNLLSQAEQQLFRRIGVFSGGCTLVAVEAVCNPRGEIPEVAANLESLMNKSLLQRDWQSEEPGNEPRFYMLETIREYARERLEERGEGVTVRRLHAEYYLAIADAPDLEPQEPKQGGWLKRLEREHDNLRAALSWATGEMASSVEWSLCLGATLCRFWFRRGHISEGRGWVDKILALVGSDEAHLSEELHVKLADLWNCAGFLAGVQADHAGAMRMLERSLDIARSLGNKPAMARALSNLGYRLWYQGAYAEAERYFRESIDLRRASGEDPMHSSAYLRLAEIAYIRGDYEEASRLCEQGLILCRRLGDRGQLVDVLIDMAMLAYAKGEPEEALRLAEESLTVSREIGYAGGEAIALTAKGMALGIQGSFGEARALLEQGLDLWKGFGDQEAISFTLMQLGKVYARQHEYASARTLLSEALRAGLTIPRYNAERVETIEWAAYLDAIQPHGSRSERGAKRAATILGAAEARREEMGAPIPPANRAHHAQAVQALRTELGQVAFDEAWQLGCTMSFEEIATFVLQEVDVNSTPPTHLSPAAESTGEP